jgi:hypothetical protein
MWRHSWIETYHVVLKWCSLGLHARPCHIIIRVLIVAALFIYGNARELWIHRDSCGPVKPRQVLKVVARYIVTPIGGFDPLSRFLGLDVSLMLLKLVLTAKPSSLGNPANKTHVQTWGLVRSMQWFVMVHENSNLLMQLMGCRLVL